MLGTKRILNQITRMRLYLRPQRLAYPDCRVLSVGSLAGTDCPCHHCFFTLIGWRIYRHWRDTGQW